jgi:hypothetical protein
MSSGGKEKGVGAIVKVIVMMSMMMISRVSSYGQEVVLNNSGNIVAEVSGNGRGVNGGGPFNQGLDGNIIRIQGNTVIGAMHSANNVSGARNEDDVRSNTAFMEGTGGVWGDIVGGRSFGTGKVVGNKVELSSGRVARDVYGGKSNSKEEEKERSRNENKIGNNRLYLYKR